MARQPARVSNGDRAMTHKLDRRAFCIAMSLIGLRAASTDAWAEDATIRLGIVAPMSGPNSRYGSFSLRGAQLAAEEINNSGGVGGRKITIISGDSQGTPVAEDAGVLLLNAASSNPKITYGAGVGGFKWTFRNYPTDALVVIQYAAEK